MNLQRMAEKCRKEQWDVGDLNWAGEPREMPREDEMAIVQYFTDMAGIERLAGALFFEQAKRTDDPVLKEIFESFVVDELRHAHAAQMLADHYDVHRYKYYQMNPSLVRFAPHFVHAIQFLSPEVANLYITTGELILDVALLRSINDYVNDEMSEAAMHLINRDESRHIAIDYFMTEYYASEQYQASLKSAPAQSFATKLRGWMAMGNVFRHARPFFKDVFFDTMDVVDPSGKRLLEAFKRIQLFSAKPRVADRPFNKFLLRLKAIHENPIGKVFLGKFVIRIMGVDARVIRTLYSEDEFERHKWMSFDQMANEALAAKFA